MDQIETPHLRLTRLTEDNLDDFHAIWSLPEATRWSSRGCRKTIEESREQMKGLLVPDGENFAVFLRTTSTTPSPPTTQMIGIVGVFRLSPIVELGYTFHPSFWGQGYATESVGAFVRRFWGIASYDPHDDGDDGYGDL
ncbi:hypothetical protein VC83_07551 [Pseudogymnoascus destructans]|uniref:N-acetyltransferase domain-containing protein n=1 Tax=Pseudogymnoascus destructans TaxID=655981 RepID=A0A177A1Q0_9PEZI|nr:uncharacterized protein VC83_07551 [Pseudogymnoascus destructans]OAF56209.1 hypothetical protein VC83_07551 [Pseudogymnoascus destructans]